MPTQLNSLFACPQCKQALIEGTSNEGSGLICSTCCLQFPVENGFPVLLIDRAEMLSVV